MKFAVYLLVLLPMVYCASIEERFLSGVFQHHLIDVTKLLQSCLGSDTTEAACQADCPSCLSAIPGGSLGAPLLCGPACKELQHLAQGR
ncbi:hypothetical protein DPMN_061366 [Dreissena polymorpha]|uniref:Uncharacterized protein n=1 Tax=Dreissena polymorpha TaxID=45954 RepID=A0A9D4C7T8_DREPO|nr:hypothetical protein DPMN_061364 [Dreissena polymorpha]KAH3718561.1 hypothetical protein DPMN_061366 [Dreissena polymorpha]